MSGVTIRTGNIYDLPFLKKMLYEAIFWNPESKRIPFDEIFQIPEISRLLDNWPQRNGDFSLIAVDAQGRPAGAIWYRFWTADDPSFGYVDDETPEIGIAVLPEFRGMGIGRSLMRNLITQAADAGIRKLSLSVDPDNFALHLYSRLGFRKVGEYGTSWTLVRELKQPD